MNIESQLFRASRMCTVTTHTFFYAKKMDINIIIEGLIVASTKFICLKPE